jgi:hypothetical protein
LTPPLGGWADKKGKGPGLQSHIFFSHFVI